MFLHIYDILWYFEDIGIRKKNKGGETVNQYWVSKGLCLYTQVVKGYNRPSTTCENMVFSVGRVHTLGIVWNVTSSNPDHSWSPIWWVYWNTNKCSEKWPQKTLSILQYSSFKPGLGNSGKYLPGRLPLKVFQWLNFDWRFKIYSNTTCKHKGVCYPAQLNVDNLKKLKQFNS